MPDTHDSILRILNVHRVMTLATVRPDGWPQATTVSYVNEELVIYCFVARLGQKLANIKSDPRVSVAIGGEFRNPSDIKGLSFAVRAAEVEDKTDYERVTNTYLERFVEYASWPRPTPMFAPLLRLTPEVISLIDYSKEFGYSELVTVSRDPAEWVCRRSDWFKN